MYNCIDQFRSKKTQQDNKTRKNKNLEKLFSENEISPLLKTPEKDFQENILIFHKASMKKSPLKG